MRNCCIIIEKIIKEIPTNKKDFIADLKFNYKAASYTVPEDNAKWLSLQTTVNKHIINPTEDWEIKVLSILMKTTYHHLSFLPNSEQQTIKAEQVFVLYTIV